MGRERLRARPSALDRLRVEIGAADRFITLVTWSCAAGMVLWSMLNATPYVRAHVAKGWEDTAFVLPLVVDAAFVGALRADEIASRHGVKAGVWPVLLRLFTGASSVFLNIGGSWETDDRTGVFQHLIAPGLLVLLAEAGPAWRRSLAAKLARAEREAEQKERQEADRARQDAERDRRRRQEDEDRQAEKDRQEAERKRLERLADEERARRQRQEDEQRAAELEEKREAARAKRSLESRRLDLEEKRLTAPVTAAPSAVNGTTAHRHDGMTAQNTRPATPAPVPVAPVAPAPHPGVWAPQARTGGDNGPAVASAADLRATAADRPASAPAPSPAPRTTDSAAFARPATPASVAAAQTAPARVTARLDDEHQEQPPTKPAGPVKDWDLPGLPADCAPGRTPELLTDAQVVARMTYGITQGWTQRRTGEFAGRSATVVNRHKQKMEISA